MANRCVVSAGHKIGHKRAVRQIQLFTQKVQSRPRRSARDQQLTMIRCTHRLDIEVLQHIIFSSYQDMPHEGNVVFLRGIKADVKVNPDAWGRTDKSQPAIISLEIEPKDDLVAAAREDDVSQTLDYGKLYKKLAQHLSTTYAEGACQLGFQIKDQIAAVAQSYKIEVHLPKASLRANGGVFYTLRHAHAPLPDGTEAGIWIETFRIAEIRCACIVGVNPHERMHKQIVDAELEFELISPEVTEVGGDREIIPHWHGLMTGYSEMVEAVAERVEGSSFQTVEALATAIALVVTMDFLHEAVSVRVEKPNAIASIDAAGVRMHRRRSFFANKDFWQVKRP